MARRRAEGPPLKVAIVTDPASSAEGVSLARDVDLVKAAVLYADEVQLVSVGAAMIAGIAQFAEGDGGGVLSLFTGMDDETLEHYTGAPLPAGWREAVTFLSQPGAEHIPGMGDLASSLREELGKSQRMMQDIAEQQMESSGATELLPAIHSGLVRLSAAGFDNAVGDTESQFDAWLDLLKELLADTQTRLVLDDQVGRLVTAMINEGMVQPRQLTKQHAGEAAVGSGLIARLPAFPQAPISEVLDLRADLANPLTKYRRAVVRLSKDMHAAPFDADMPDKIDDLWNTEIQPALAELHDGLHDHGLVREIARAARDDVKTLIATGPGLYLAFAAVGTVNELVSTAVPAAAPVIAAAAKGQATHAKEQKRLRDNDLLYLYEVSKRLNA